MRDFNNIKSKFEDNLKMVDQIVNIGNDIGDLVVSFLEDLQKRYESMPAFMEYKTKLVTVIDSIRNLKEHPSLQNKYQIIYNQALVLIIENFESFLNDLTKELINNYSHLINWPDHKKKLPVDVTLLRYSSPTGGDLVLTSLKGEVSFQDLQSTLRFLEEYLNLKIQLSDSERDTLILGQALRNIVIHNNNKVDHGFLNQIRETSYKTKYKDKSEIMLTKDEYENFKKSFIDFATKISDSITQKK